LDFWGGIGRGNHLSLQECELRRITMNNGNMTELNKLWIVAGAILVVASLLIPLFKTHAPAPTKIFVKSNDNEDVISHFQITRSTTISLIRDKKTGDCFIISDSKDASTRLKVECD
jgi:hypothetical protein